MRGLRTVAALQVLVFCFSVLFCVSVKGIDRAELVMKLYEAAEQLVSDSKLDPSFCMSIEKAREYVGEDIGYLNGRLMDIVVPAEGSDDDELDTFLYNHYNGKGLAEKVVESMRPK